MKKTLTTLMFVILFAGVSVAQIEKGTVLVGASSNLGYSSASNENSDDNVNLFILDLKAGYFLIDNLAAGLSFGYTKYSGDNLDGSSTAFGLFGRYYVNGKFFLGLGYNSTKVEDAEAVKSVPLEAGYAAFITDNIAIEPSLRYAIGVGDNESNSFGLNVGFALYFNRK